MRYVLNAVTVLFLLVVCAPVFAQAQEEWPQDARDVGFAVAAKVTGQQGLSNVSFAPGVEANMEGAGNQFYADFDAGKIVFVSYENYGTGANYNADVIGVANLVDRDGRIVALQFLARYTVQGQNIVVNECYAATASPPTVPIEVYAVPYEKFRDELPEEARDNWASVYQFARENTYDPRKDESRKTNYLVMSFVKSRLPDNAKFEAIVSDRKSARREKNNIARQHDEFLDYQGWRVHMFAAKYKPTSLKERFYINYYYTPGSGVPEAERDRIQVARYDSRPDPESVVAKESVASQPQAAPAPAPQAVAPAPAPVAKPAPAQTPAPAVSGGGDGPLAQGMSFLNPIFPDDVALIQQRLKDLGRYGGPVDKTFGPTTKRALDNFASESGFPKGQWSLGLQKALFKGSGL